MAQDADNRKNNFLVLGEGPNFGINGSFGSAEKKFSINFCKTNTKFYLSVYYNAENSYFIVNGKQIFKFKDDNKYLSNSILSQDTYLMHLALLSLEKYH